MIEDEPLMDAVVILAGEQPAGYAEQVLRQSVAAGALVVAADSGADRLAPLGLAPHFIVGDGDSLQGSFPRARTVSYPPRKDFTDGQAALELACQRAEGRVWLLGALGGRPDHQLGNLLLPLSCGDFRRVWLAGADWQGRYLGPGSHLIPGRRGDTVSLLPLTETEGLTLEGFEYPLRDHRARVGDSRTLSNVLAAPPGRVELKAGVVLAIHLLSALDAPGSPVSKEIEL